MEESVNQLRFLASKPSGEEQGKLSDSADVDLDTGDSNDFEVTVAASEWNPETLGYGCRLYIPNTEYGGIIQDIESVTATGNVILRGDTWRGMLAYRIIEPPTGQNHLALSGELNDVIRELIGDRFGSLFYVPEIDTGITVSKRYAVTKNFAKGTNDAITIDIPWSKIVSIQGTLRYGANLHALPTSPVGGSGTYNEGMLAQLVITSSNVIQLWVTTAWTSTTLTVVVGYTD